MARERAKSAEAPGKLCRPPHGFPGTRQNASVCIVPRVHLENVGKVEIDHIEFPISPS